MTMDTMGCSGAAAAPARVGKPDGLAAACTLGENRGVGRRGSTRGAGGGDERRSRAVSRGVRGERTAAARVGRLGDGQAGGWDFERPAVLVGRDPRADLVLGHPLVGLRHAYLQLVEGRLFATDLGSREGLHWGGVPRRSGWIDRSRPLQVGVTTIRVVEGGRAGDGGPGGPSSRRCRNGGRCRAPCWRSALGGRVPAAPAGPRAHASGAPNAATCGF